MSAAGVPVCWFPGDQPSLQRGGPQCRAGSPRAQGNASAVPRCPSWRPVLRAVSPQGSSCHSLLAGFASRKKRRWL